jgi:hypothetical protein
MHNSPKGLRGGQVRLNVVRNDRNLNVDSAYRSILLVVTRQNYCYIMLHAIRQLRCLIQDFAKTACQNILYYESEGY